MGRALRGFTSTPQLPSTTWRFMGSYKWVISRVTILIAHVRGLMALLITTHEPPSIGGKTSRGRTGTDTSFPSLTPTVKGQRWPDNDLRLDAYWTTVEGSPGVYRSVTMRTSCTQTLSSRSGLGRSRLPPTCATCSATLTWSTASAPSHPWEAPRAATRDGGFTCRISASNTHSILTQIAEVYA